MSRRLFTIGLLFVFSLLFVSGCGPKQPRRTNVRGTVTCDGKPVTAGAIDFYSEGNKSHCGSQIDGSGNYEARNVLEGTYTVKFSPPIFDPREAPKEPVFFPIAQKYFSYETSGLTMTVKEGENNPTANFDIPR